MGIFEKTREDFLFSLRFSWKLQIRVALEAKSSSPGPEWCGRCWTPHSDQRHCSTEVYTDTPKCGTHCSASDGFYPHRNKHGLEWHSGFFLCPSYNMRVCLATVLLGMPRVCPPYSTPIPASPHFLILRTPLSFSREGFLLPVSSYNTLCFLGLDWNYLQVNLVLSEEKEKVVSLGVWLTSSYPCELCPYLHILDGHLLSDQVRVV